jgi:hypothetical protein
MDNGEQVVAGILTSTEPLEVHIGQYHDYLAMNAHEMVIDPTPEDCDRILAESAIDIRQDDPRTEEHVHTEACAQTEELESRLNAEPQKPLTEAQFRKLRGLYFTVRHHRVQPCGHLLDQINEPTFRNCEACWFCFFNSHGQLVEVTDKAIQEQGFRFLDKMRGRKYRKMFCRFMNTVMRAKRESDERAREAENSNDQSGEIQSSESGGEGVRQEAGEHDVPAVGGQGQPTNS